MPASATEASSRWQIVVLSDHELIFFLSLFPPPCAQPSSFARIRYLVLECHVPASLLTFSLYFFNLFFYCGMVYYGMGKMEVNASVYCKYEQPQSSKSLSIYVFSLTRIKFAVESILNLDKSVTFHLWSSAVMLTFSSWTVATISNLLAVFLCSSVWNDLVCSLTVLVTIMGGVYRNPYETKSSNHREAVSIFNHHNFVLTSVLVILLLYCCLFCVLSNDMLNVFNDTFSYKIHASASWSLKTLYP